MIEYLVIGMLVVAMGLYMIASGVAHLRLVGRVERLELRQAMGKDDS